jgi:hypothetical protein
MARSKFRTREIVLTACTMAESGYLAYLHGHEPLRHHLFRCINVSVGDAKNGDLGHHRPLTVKTHTTSYNILAMQWFRKNVSRVCENPDLIHMRHTAWYLALFKSWSVRRQRVDGVTRTHKSRSGQCKTMLRPSQLKLHNHGSLV